MKIKTTEDILSSSPDWIETFIGSIRVLNIAAEEFKGRTPVIRTTEKTSAEQFNAAADKYRGINHGDKYNYYYDIFCKE